MEKEKSPAFQFYPKDLLSDAVAMSFSNSLLGSYLKLLCYDWLDDGILDSDKTIAVLGGLNPKHQKEGVKSLRKKFIRHPHKSGCITNPRLIKERKKQADWREKSSRGGKQSAKLRATKVQPTGQPNGNTPSSSSSPSSSSKNKNTLSGKPDGNYEKELRDFNPKQLIDQAQAFEIAWEYYPKPAGKKEAKKHFKATVKNKSDWDRIAIAFNAYCDHVNFERANGHKKMKWQNGSTWFNNWEEWWVKAENEPARVPKL